MLQGKTWYNEKNTHHFVFLEKRFPGVIFIQIDLGRDQRRHCPQLRDQDKLEDFYLDGQTKCLGLKGGKLVGTGRIVLGPVVVWLPLAFAV